MLQIRPGFDDLTPALAAAIGTALARQPSPAPGLDPHQNGLAMKEDFVQTHHQHQTLASPIQDLQDTPRLLMRFAAPSVPPWPGWAPDGGATRSPTRPQSGSGSTPWQSPQRRVHVA